MPLLERLLGKDDNVFLFYLDFRCLRFFYHSVKTVGFYHEPNL